MALLVSFAFSTFPPLMVTYSNDASSSLVDGLSNAGIAAILS